MPDTFQALLIFVLAVLPGALYTWALERQVGRWGIGLSDRVLRFIAVSAIFQVAFIGPLYALRNEYVHHRVVEGKRVRFENRLADGKDVPVWLLLVPVAYLGLPIAAGTAVAAVVRRKSPRARKLARIFAGRDPAPRAWDALFAPRPSGLVRLRLKDKPPENAWIGGLFGEDSYAAGYPEEPQDLFLEAVYRMNADGSFARDENGGFLGTGSSLLIRWEELQFLEFFSLEEAGDGNG